MSNKTLELNSQDFLVNPDGTVTIKSPELHEFIAGKLMPPIHVDSPPYGPGEPGHPLPAPPKPIVTIIITF